MRISINKFFEVIAGVLFAIAALITASPLINISGLQFPERLDSASVSNARQEMIKQMGSDSSKDLQTFYYNPGQLNLSYKKFSVKVDNETSLKCWLIEGKESQNSPLLIMLHDINDSKIGLLPEAKEFADRGFNVCLVDMRAHGESGGNNFTLGDLEQFDIAKLADSVIKLTGNPRIALMGFGIGANIAIQAATINRNIKCLILQSPTDSLLSYVKHYTVNKWGPLAKPFFPIMLRSLQKSVGFRVETTVMSNLTKRLSIPISVICGTHDEDVSPQDSRNVYEACPSGDKQFWPVMGADHYNIAEKAGDEYYNYLAYFINCAIPKPTVNKGRFKKLV